ncbi:acyl-CoA thioesterase [Jiangella endophytica]|uniref:acyl-CoA thioesterase n=1 Tax=Jiangella endophytica TaxID=1623398 RepID=UPI00130022BC|nr:acyl-CoA thioesterase domain-containing protein [Jiangella endophytica]
MSLAVPEPVGSTLDLAELSPDVFGSTGAHRIATADARGGAASRDGDRRRVFGGQLLGQALRAACRSVPAGRLPRSLHAYFLAGPDPGLPLEYVVERVRDGRTVSHRRVRARQSDRELLSLEASFDAAEPGFEFQDRPAAGAGPDQLSAATGEAAHDWSGVELRFAENTAAGFHAAHRRIWMRTRHPLPPDPVLHACALTYMSDLALIRTALLPEPVASHEAPVRLASLDHAVWFHRPAPADRWLLLESIAPASRGTRALTIGHVYDEAGRLAVTVAQQGTLRAQPGPR